MNPATPVLDVSVIYVSWNSADEIRASVATVREATRDLGYEIIVVDNASPEGPGGLENLPGVHFVQSTMNGGFGAGCNLGARHASGRHLLFLNPDTRLSNNVLACLTLFLDTHPRAGAAGPMILDEQGRVFEGARFLPTFYNEFLAHATITGRFPNFAWTSRPYLTRRAYLSTREVESVIGACLLVRSELFRALGGFDEKFFLYCEEFDFCHRIRNSGFEVWYVHTAKLIHSQQKSTMQFFGSARKVEFQHLRSQLYYFRKHRGALVAFLWREMVALLYFLRYLKGRDEIFMEYVRWALSNGRLKQ